MIPVYVIVGLVVLGGIVRFAVAEGGISQMQRIFGAKRAGGLEAARAALDRMWKPATRPDRAFSPRLAALALLGDREQLAREVAAIQGSARMVGYQKAYGLLGLVLVGDADAPAQLAAHAAAFERDAPALMSKVKQAVRGIAEIGAALSGGPGSIEPIQRLRPDLFAFAVPWTKALVWECCARAYERAGQADKAANCRVANGHFERARGQAA
jgi:hypothetical protein